MAASRLDVDRTRPGTHQALSDEPGFRRIPVERATTNVLTPDHPPIAPSRAIRAGWRRRARQPSGQQPRCVRCGHRDLEPVGLIGGQHSTTTSSAVNRAISLVGERFRFGDGSPTMIRDVFATSRSLNVCFQSPIHLGPSPGRRPRPAPREFRGGRCCRPPSLRRSRPYPGRRHRVGRWSGRSAGGG